METVKKFIKEHPHMWWGLYLPVYLTMFFIIEHLITDNYWATQTAIDDYYSLLRCVSFSPMTPGPSCWWPSAVPDHQGRRGLPAVYVDHYDHLHHCHGVLCPGAQRPEPAPGGNGAPQHRRLAAAEHSCPGHQHQRVPQRPCAGGHRGGVRRVAHAGSAEVGLARGSLAWASSSSPPRCLSSSTPLLTFWRACLWGLWAISSCTSSSERKETA